MSKDPAFLFYPQDFLTGVTFMNNTQRGIYITLLCSQHQMGGIIETASFDALVGDDLLIRGKFLKCEQGYYNIRLIEEMEKREKKSSNISNAVKDVWIKRKNAIAMESHNNSIKKTLKNDAIAMGIENENEDVIFLGNKEGVAGETLKGDFIKLKNEPDHWQETMKLFLNDFDFKKSCCDFYNCQWVDMEDRMIKFLNGVHLKQNYQEIAALKKYFRNHYTKHYLNNGSSVKDLREKNQGALSNGFIEAPKNFDYDKMEKW